MERIENNGCVHFLGGRCGNWTERFCRIFNFSFCMVALGNFIFVERSCQKKGRSQCEKDLLHCGFILSDFENSPSGNDKTSILVNLPDEQGVLVRFLNDFNNAGINLTKIKSHIVEGNSIFFIDFDGHKDDENIKKVLEKHKSSIKVLGSYVKEIKDI